MLPAPSEGCCCNCGSPIQTENGMGMEAIVPGNGKNWEAIDIYLFENGQEGVPPRKYHLTYQDLNAWDDTLENLSKNQSETTDIRVDLFTIKGEQIKSPLELQNGSPYVAVVPPDCFVDSGYDKYLVKATRSLEKRLKHASVIRGPNEEEMNSIKKCLETGCCEMIQITSPCPTPINVIQNRPKAQDRIPSLSDNSDLHRYNRKMSVPTRKRPTIPRYQPAITSSKRIMNSLPSIRKKSLSKTNTKEQTPSQNKHNIRKKYAENLKRVSIINRHRRSTSIDQNTVQAPVPPPVINKPPPDTKPIEERIAERIASSLIASQEAEVIIAPTHPYKTDVPTKRDSRASTSPFGKNIINYNLLHQLILDMADKTPKKFFLENPEGTLTDEKVVQGIDELRDLLEEITAADKYEKVTIEDHLNPNSENTIITNVEQLRSLLNVMNTANIVLKSDKKIIVDTVQPCYNQNIGVTNIDQLNMIVEKESNATAKSVIANVPIDNKSVPKKKTPLLLSSKKKPSSKDEEIQIIVIQSDKNVGSLESSKFDSKTTQEPSNTAVVAPKVDQYVAVINRSDGNANISIDLKSAEGGIKSFVSGQQTSHVMKIHSGSQILPLNEITSIDEKVLTNLLKDAKIDQNDTKLIVVKCICCDKMKIVDTVNPMQVVPEENRPNDRVEQADCIDVKIVKQLDNIIKAMNESGKIEQLDDVQSSAPATSISKNVQGEQILEVTDAVCEAVFSEAKIVIPICEDCKGIHADNEACVSVPKSVSKALSPDANQSIKTDDTQTRTQSAKSNANKSTTKPGETQSRRQSVKSGSIRLSTVATQVRRQSIKSNPIQSITKPDSRRQSLKSNATQSTTKPTTDEMQLSSQRTKSNANQSTTKFATDETLPSRQRSKSNINVNENQSTTKFATDETSPSRQRTKSNINVNANQSTTKFATDETSPSRQRTKSNINQSTTKFATDEISPSRQRTKSNVNHSITKFTKSSANITKHSCIQLPSFDETQSRRQSMKPKVTGSARSTTDMRQPSSILRTKSNANQSTTKLTTDDIEPSEENSITNVGLKTDEPQSRRPSIKSTTDIRQPSRQRTKSNARQSTTKLMTDDTQSRDQSMKSNTNVSKRTSTDERQSRRRSTRLDVIGNVRSKSKSSQRSSQNLRRKSNANESIHTSDQTRSTTDMRSPSRQRTKSNARQSTTKLTTDDMHSRDQSIKSNTNLSIKPTTDETQSRRQSLKSGSVRSKSKSSQITNQNITTDEIQNRIQSIITSTANENISPTADERQSQKQSMVSDIMERISIDIIRQSTTRQAISQNPNKDIENENIPVVESRNTSQRQTNEPTSTDRSRATNNNSKMSRDTTASSLATDVSNPKQRQSETEKRNVSQTTDELPPSGVNRSLKEIASVEDYDIDRQYSLNSCGCRVDSCCCQIDSQTFQQTDTSVPQVLTTLDSCGCGMEACGCRIDSQTNQQTDTSISQGYQSCGCGIDLCGCRLDLPIIQQNYYDSGIENYNEVKQPSNNPSVIDTCCYNEVNPQPSNTSVIDTCCYAPNNLDEREVSHTSQVPISENNARLATGRSVSIDAKITARTLTPVSSSENMKKGCCMSFSRTKNAQVSTSEIPPSANESNEIKNEWLNENAYQSEYAAPPITNKKTKGITKSSATSTSDVQTSYVKATQSVALINDVPSEGEIIQIISKKDIYATIVPIETSSDEQRKNTEKKGSQTMKKISISNSKSENTPSSSTDIRKSENQPGSVRVLKANSISPKTSKSSNYTGPSIMELLQKEKESVKSSGVFDKMSYSPNYLVDKYTQTESLDVLLVARRHEDSHYSFHFPTLEDLKQYQLI